MKIIFLDIDGVLNYMGSSVLDNTCVENLRYLVSETGAKIVLISTWKQFLDGNILKDLSDKDKKEFVYYRELLNTTFINELKIIDTVEDYFSMVDAEVKSVVSLSDLSEEECEHDAWRSVEIDWWLKKHSEVESFVIIDDFDCEYHKFYPNNWVQTSWFRDGLSRDIAENAISILNKQ